MFQQILERGLLEISAGEAAIIVMLRNHGPTEMALAFDVGLGSFALRL